MASSEKYKPVEAAQFRALAFLFATLLLLGSGSAFAQEHRYPSGERDAALQLHARPTDAALAASAWAPEHNPFAAPHRPGHGGPPAGCAASSSGRYCQAIGPGREAGAAGIVPGLRLCILFSCQRLAEPPPSMS